MPDTTLTEVDDIVAVWRPLSKAEEDRAEGLIAQAERALMRTYLNIPARLASEIDPLTRDDVADVVVWLVIPIIAPGTEMPPNARSYQATAGSESRSITLDGTGMLTLAGWMVDVFEPRDRSAAGAGTGLQPMFGGGRGADRLAGLFSDWRPRGSAH
jgi:hypothetical protein